MKKEYHIITTLAFLIVFAYIFEKVTVTMCMAAFIYCLVPDIDQLDGINQFIGHRNIILHSIIPWVIVGIFNPDPVFALIPAVVGLHCLMDIRWREKQQVGYYTLTITNGVRLSGKFTTVWLLINFGISFGFLLAWCLI